MGKAKVHGKVRIGEEEGINGVFSRQLAYNSSKDLYVNDFGQLQSMYGGVRQKTVAEREINCGVRSALLRNLSSRGH